jgi:2-methylfumaryl-CoA hydratase
MTDVLRPLYGRKLDDFEVGATYAHPWEVTLDAGMVALFSASFLDATPTFASAAYAKELGFRDRPIHPLMLLNLGLSFSVHDVSEQAIAHLAYIDARFPSACYAGDTVHAWSTVLGKKAASSGDKGVVHVRTVVATEHAPVCAFERKALVRAGSVEGRLEGPRGAPSFEASELSRLPPELSTATPPERERGFAGFFEDFSVGQIFCHQNGKTVGESEHMQLTLLLRNSHPIHFDEVYCDKEGRSFAGTRVVYGGLVLGFVASLASRDTTGNAAWDMGWDDGAHPSGVVAGDTLFAASKILETRPIDARWGEVTLRLVGTKNERPDALLDAGADLFTPEREKERGAGIGSKVLEITRRVLVRRRPT